MLVDLVVVPWRVPTISFGPLVISHPVTAVAGPDAALGIAAALLSAAVVVLAAGRLLGRAFRGCRVVALALCVCLLALIVAKIFLQSGYLGPGAWAAVALSTILVNMSTPLRRRPV